MKRELVHPPSRPRITIVDDDLVTCELLCEVFTQEGFVTGFAQSEESALAVINVTHPDVIVSDIRMKSNADGFSLLARVRRDHPSTPIVLITAFGSVETAIRAVQEGAFEYISKPFDIASLVSTVRRALAIQAPEPPAQAEQTEDLPEDLTRHIVGRSRAILEVYKMVARVADSSASLVITGESGTGKELVARAIHQYGARHSQPFVAVNCGALTETLLESELFGHVRGSFTGAIANRRGVFEQAGAGTVFLDEIGETSPALQVKLLRVLQEHEVVPVGGSTTVPIRARVLAATNTDLEQLAATGAFRRDLLYRLNVITIHLPPLRERGEDLPFLISHFLRKCTPAGAPVPVLDEEAQRALADYAWPGNVRELENTIERAVTLSRGRIVTA
ncbi:MAG TPA: sigma-54 dependent transcriptional regulator, partial [Vicinamibacterales bacterium]|nr:sigma-54 dependent transcriptional regulator [Vicinamibacterales bacterium]